MIFTYHYSNCGALAPAGCGPALCEATTAYPVAKDIIYSCPECTRDHLIPVTTPSGVLSGRVGITHSTVLDSEIRDRTRETRHGTSCGAAAVLSKRFARCTAPPNQDATENDAL